MTENIIIQTNQKAKYHCPKVVLTEDASKLAWYDFCCHSKVLEYDYILRREKGKEKKKMEISS